MLKKLAIALTLILALTFPTSMNAQKGDAAFGVQTGYTSTNGSAIAGLFFNYGLSDAVRISPEMGFVFRNQDLDAFTFDINVHFPLEFSADVCELYPLVGMDVSSWTHHLMDTGLSNDVSTRSTKVGLNMGAGFRYNATDMLMFKIECKYTMMSLYSTFVASVGIGYRF